MDKNCSLATVWLIKCSSLFSFTIDDVFYIYNGINLLASAKNPFLYCYVPMLHLVCTYGHQVKKKKSAALIHLQIWIEVILLLIPDTCVEILAEKSMRNGKINFNEVRNCKCSFLIRAKSFEITPSNLFLTLFGKARHFGRFLNIVDECVNKFVIKCFWLFSSAFLWMHIWW